jgi:plasmid maintenance system antidote protein VapI
VIKTRINTTSKHLSNLMGALALHVNDLAELAGVHRTTVFRWLSGQANIPVSVIRMLELMKDKQNV